MLLTRLYKFLKKAFSRSFFIFLSVIMQVAWFTLFIFLLGEQYPFFAGVIRAFSVLAVLWVTNKRTNPSYKLAWVLTLLLFPLVGYTVYLMFGKSRIPRKVSESFRKVELESQGLLAEPEEDREALAAADRHINRQSLYIRDFAGYPVYRNTKAEYYASGEELFPAMVEELKKARYFIFLEYFIIDSGEMWDTILNILELKVHEGLDVRLIYDDVGSVNTLPARYYKEIRKRGIKCEVFNPFRPVVSAFMNNRDHRKIMVIDGHTGFTGGINLADEYINRKKRFGHWKDTGVMLYGEAVWNFTIMFLQMWSVITAPSAQMADTKLYRPQMYHPLEFETDGYVQPYCDTPLDDETVGENVYLNMIAQAKRYIYIFTPYLIIDNEMMTALALAAKGGVDVRIVTPGIPDKRMIFILTRSYYEQLLEAGVRIFEYIPGFLHAKSFVCDDETAVVGTINLDYRSLYLHFECGVWMYRSRAVMQVKQDALDTIAHSREVTIEECRKTNIPVRLAQSGLRLLAPML